jgi:hypothetical protein
MLLQSPQHSSSLDIFIRFLKKRQYREVSGGLPIVPSSAAWGRSIGLRENLQV